VLDVRPPVRRAAIESGAQKESSSAVREPRYGDSPAGTRQAELFDAPAAIVLGDGPGTAIDRLLLHIAEPSRYDSDNLAKALAARQERRGLKIQDPSVALEATVIHEVVASREGKVCDVGGIRLTVTEYVHGLTRRAVPLHGV
jgi:hypothetical protein